MGGEKEGKKGEYGYIWSLCLLNVYEYDEFSDTTP